MFNITMNSSMNSFDISIVYSSNIRTHMIQPLTFYGFQNYFVYVAGGVLCCEGRDIWVCKYHCVRSDFRAKVLAEEAEYKEQLLKLLRIPSIT